MSPQSVTPTLPLRGETGRALPALPYKGMSALMGTSISRKNRGVD